jgi:hypothetical protein
MYICIHVYMYMDSVEILVERAPDRTCIYRCIYMRLRGRYLWRGRQIEGFSPHRQTLSHCQKQNQIKKKKSPMTVRSEYILCVVDSDLVW